MSEKATGSCVLQVKVVPRAAREEVCGEEGGILKVRLTAPPVEGKANSALVALLSRTLNVPRKNIHIRSGERSRLKTVDIAGLGPNEVSRRLGLGGPSSMTSNGPL